MSYQVLITQAATHQILAQGRYIAVDCEAPLNAERWLERIFDAADTLAEFPQRFPLAPENDFRDYEIRRLRVGDYFLLYSIVEDSRRVWVIGFRHGMRLPRFDELPEDLPS